MLFRVPECGPLTPPEIRAEIELICARTVLPIPIREPRSLWDTLFGHPLRRAQREVRDALAREEALRQESLRIQNEDHWF